MCTVCSSGDVQTKFYLLPRLLNHVSCYSFNGWCDPVLQVLDIPYLLSLHNVLYPRRKKSSGERSGLRGGQGIGPPLPIQGSGNLSFKTSVTKQLKWGRAPSCIKITLLTIPFSKVSSYNFLSYSGFKPRPSFSMTLYCFQSCLALGMLEVWVQQDVRVICLWFCASWRCDLKGPC